MPLTRAQHLMVDDGLPLSAIMNQQERDKAWKENPPRAYAAPYLKDVVMTESEIWLLFDLKDSKERGAASLSCGQRILQIAQLVKLGFARQHHFGETQFFITDAGMVEAKKHERPETLKDAYVLSGTGPAKPVKATVVTPRPPGSSKGKALEVVGMMRKPGGVTREEVLVAIGWTAISMQQQAAAAGVELTIDKSRKPYRYSVK